MSRRWTVEEDEFLSDYWGVKPFNRLRNELGRSDNSIRWRATVLGLGPYIESMDGYTLRQLANAIGMHHTSVHRWVTHYGLPAVKRVNGTNRKTYCIKPEDFWKWAEANVNRINLSGMEELALGPEPDWVRDKRLKDKERRVNREKRAWSTGEIEKLVTLQQKGLSTREIASMIGRSQASVKVKLWREMAQ